MPEHDFLRVENIHKRFPYGDDWLQVLKGISFTLPAGATASIVGESGSGKSTLLHVLGGMETPGAGTIMLKGVDLYQLGMGERATLRNRNIGFVFQFHHLLPEFNAMENLMMPLMIRRERTQTAREKALAMLTELGLSHRSRSRPGQLSGGEQQRLAIGRALITQPSLLLLDEPTGNLDRATGERVMETVFELAARRAAAVVLVTHNPELAHRCQSQYLMTDGLLAPLTWIPK